MRTAGEFPKLPCSRRYRLIQSEVPGSAGPFASHIKSAEDQNVLTRVTQADKALDAPGLGTPPRTRPSQALPCCVPYSRPPLVYTGLHGRDVPVIQAISSHGSWPLASVVLTTDTCLKKRTSHDEG
jgi:hypothetical protein